MRSLSWLPGGKAGSQGGWAAPIPGPPELGLPQCLSRNENLQLDSRCQQL